jgi:FHS family L-fucose permease-like MFS transporter
MFLPIGRVTVTQGTTTQKSTVQHDEKGNYILYQIKPNTEFYNCNLLQPFFVKRNYYIVALIMLTFFVISFLTNVIGALNPDFIKGFDLSLTLAAFLPFRVFYCLRSGIYPDGYAARKIQGKKDHDRRFCGGLCRVAAAGRNPQLYQCDHLTFPHRQWHGDVAGGDQPIVAHVRRRGALCVQLRTGATDFWGRFFYQPDGLLLFRTKSKRTTFGDNGPVQRHSSRNLPWISLYWIFGVISLLMIVIIRVSRFPVVELKADEEVGPLQTHIMLFKKRVVVLFFIAMICYVGTEQGIANWISKFLETYHHYDPQTRGADTVAYFWGMMTAGGVVGLFLLEVNG